VTDEEDQSPGSVDLYQAAFENLKGAIAGEAFSFHSISALDQNCGDRGFRYEELAQRSGGRVENLCGNWSSSLSALADAVFTLPREFRLSRVPRSGTIAVRVNGATMAQGDGESSGWALLAAARAIRFAASATPPAGATIEISYTAECL